jgi:hypothetical protein
MEERTIMSTNEDTLRSLGKLLSGGQGERDAVHIAVAPVVAAMAMPPGAPVVLTEDGRATEAEEDVTGIGVVDPFLADGPDEGDRFWLYLTPGSITSLRHDWTHPAFPAVAPLRSALAEPPEVIASKAWLRERAEPEGLSLSRVLEVAESGDSLTIYGSDCHLQTDDEFWRHVEIVTGRKFDKNHRSNVYFSCSC